ncbi:MAG: hypothetical protein ACOCSE_01715 [Chitinivibrionales bacterium]
MAWTTEAQSMQVPRIEKLKTAYQTIVTQQYKLDHIRDEFPELSNSAEAASSDFETSALNEGVGVLEEVLSLSLGSMWPEYSKEVKTAVVSGLEDIDYTEEQASEFIQKVHKRAEGMTSELDMLMLLSLNPRYIKNPEQEVSEGWIKTFDTADLLGYEGENFTLEIPMSWSVSDPDQSMAIQGFESGLGYGQVICLLMNSDVSGSDMEDSEFDKSLFYDLKKAHSLNAEMLASEQVNLNGLPGGKYVSDVSAGLFGDGDTLRSVTFMTKHQHHLITMNFIILDGADTDVSGAEVEYKGVIDNPESSVDSIQKKYMPLLYSIAESIEFQ